MTFAVLVSFAFAITISGCFKKAISYKPDLSLGESPDMIKARVKIEELIDASPPADKRKRGIFAKSATEPDSLSGALATGVTNDTVSDFSANGVFEVVGRKTDNPDLIFRGTIRRFYGEKRLTPIGAVAALVPVPIGPADFFLIGGLIFLGFPFATEQGDVQMDIFIYNSDDLLLGTYSAQSSFNKKWITIYNGYRYEIGKLLNNSFNEVISNIRSQLLADAGKFQSIKKASSAGSR